MKPTDQDQFLEVVLGLAEMFGKKLLEVGLELYWRSLKHWGIEDFRTAASHLTRICQFMPVPHDFERLRRAASDTPGEAWAKVLAHCESGSWRIGSHDNGKIDNAVRMLGGYRLIALTPLDKLGFLERRFTEHYAAIEEVETIRVALPQIAGKNARQLSHKDP